MSVRELPLHGPLMLVITWLAPVMDLPMILWRGQLGLFSTLLFGLFIAYFGSLAVLWLGVHVTWLVRVGKGKRVSYNGILRRAFMPILLCTTALVIGMAGFLWWTYMLQWTANGLLDGILLKNIIWWGLTFCAVVIGWLVAYPMDASPAVSHR